MFHESPAFLTAACYILHQNPKTNPLHATFEHAWGGLRFGLRQAHLSCGSRAHKHFIGGSLRRMGWLTLNVSWLLWVLGPMGLKLYGYIYMHASWVGLLLWVWVGLYVHGFGLFFRGCHMDRALYAWVESMHLRIWGSLWIVFSVSVCVKAHLYIQGLGLL